MSRRILTKDAIDELLAGGTTEVRLESGDIVTALAKEYALERGLRLIPAGGPAPAPTPTAPGGGEVSPAAAVRKAVVSALGYEPDGLDAVIAKALK